MGIKAISANGLIFVLLAMVYNYLAATSIIDELLIKVAKRWNFDPAINHYNFGDTSSREKIYIQASGLLIPILIAIFTAYLPVERLWRTEIIIKSTFAVILIANMSSVWFLRIETTILRYIVNDFLFLGYILSYQLVFYAGQNPLSDELVTQLIHCLAVFRSFRLTFTNVNVAALGWF